MRPTSWSFQNTLMALVPASVPGRKAVSMLSVYSRPASVLTSCQTLLNWLSKSNSMMALPSEAGRMKSLPQTSTPLSECQPPTDTYGAQVLSAMPEVSKLPSTSKFAPSVAVAPISESCPPLPKMVSAPDAPCNVSLPLPPTICVMM